MAQDLARSDAAKLAGNGLAGLLYGIARAVPFFAEAGGYLFSIVGALSLRTSLKVDLSGDHDKTGWFGSMKVGLRWLLDHPSLLAVWANLGIINLSLTAIDVLVIIFARRGGATSFETGIAVAIGSAGAIIGAAIASRVIGLLSSAGALLAALWACVVLIPVLAVAPGFIGLGLVLAGISLLVPAANVVLMSDLQRQLDDHLRGRVWSFLGLLISGLGALGPVVGGALADSVGRDAALVLIAPALFTALSFTLIPALRNHARTPKPTPATGPAET